MKIPVSGFAHECLGSLKVVFFFNQMFPLEAAGDKPKATRF